MLQPARGTRDILGEEALLKEHFLSEFAKRAQNSGFNYIETPIFEDTSVFKPTLGETSDIVGKEMYSFEDRGGSSLTLRPEGTAPVIRALISNGLTQTLPQKFFYHGPMFRYERPQKGRYRQFHQACIEFIGSNHPFADVEVMALGHALLTSLGIKGVELNINTLGDTQSRLVYREKLIEYFNKYKEDLSEDSKVRLEKNPLRILDSKDENDQKILKTAPLLADSLNDESKSFFDGVLNGLDTLKIPYIYNTKIVRGLDYYTHTAFEFKTEELGAQDAVIAGGRYDNLVKQMGGPDVPAVGFGMGIERICLLMTPNNIQNTPPVGILPIGESDYSNGLLLAQMLRENNIKCELPLNGNLNKRFKQLERYDCNTAIIFGSDEWQNGSVKIKHLKATSSEKKEETIFINKLVDFFKK